MKAVKRLIVVFSGCALALTGAVIAETKVEVKKTHICCPQCENVVAKVLEKNKVKGSATKGKEGTIVFEAPDDKAAQKVLDDLAAAGFHGETGNKDLKIKDDSGVKEGKMTTLTLKTHDCCGQCNNAIKAALKKVDGVQSDDAKAKSDTFTVTGNFEGRAVVKALNEIGFHVTVPKPKDKDEKDKEEKKDK